MNAIEYMQQELQTGKELGRSSDEWEGLKIAGNTFDYSFIHGKAIQAAGNYSFGINMKVV